jgi:hypothetical protein
VKRAKAEPVPNPFPGPLTIAASDAGRQAAQVALEQSADDLAGVLQPFKDKASRLDGQIQQTMADSESSRRTVHGVDADAVRDVIPVYVPGVDELPAFWPERMKARVHEAETTAERARATLHRITTEIAHYERSGSMPSALVRNTWTRDLGVNYLEETPGIVQRLIEEARVLATRIEAALRDAEGRDVPRGIKPEPAHAVLTPEPPAPAYLAQPGSKRETRSAHDL